MTELNQTFLVLVTSKLVSALIPRNLSGNFKVPRSGCKLKGKDPLHHRTHLVIEIPHKAGEDQLGQGVGLLVVPAVLGVAEGPRVAPALPVQLPIQGHLPGWIQTIKTLINELVQDHMRVILKV